MRSIVNILQGNTIRFPFIVETLPVNTDAYKQIFRYNGDEIDPDNPTPIYFESDNIRETNNWYSYWDKLYTNGSVEIRPTTVRIIVPDLNPSTYSDGLEYAVDITTRIGLRNISLNCSVFSTGDLMTLEHPFQEAGYDYHQYIDFTIPNPWDVCYSDDCVDLRTEYCYEPLDTNNCGSLVDVEINTVLKSEMYGSECWIMTDNYVGGRNLLLLGGDSNDYMSMSISEITYSEQEQQSKLTVPVYVCQMNINSSYGNDLASYISETYLLNNELDSVIYEMVVMDEENIYKIIDSDPIPASDPGVLSHEFSFTDDDCFDGWEDYVEGMRIVSTCRMFDTYGNEFMDIRSNSIPVTTDRFSMMIRGTGSLVQVITYPIGEMTIENIDAVNKIVKNVVSVQRPDEYKSNIVRPVFYQAYSAEDIVLHKSVQFNIGIDLDNYKSKVDSFTIQIEGISFPEVARVPGYVIFKISGEKLDKSSETGTYYILDGDGMLVTTGKYTYAS